MSTRPRQQVTRARRVVLDTNIVISSLVFSGGDSARLRLAWQAGTCIPLVSTTTAQELVRVLSYPKFRLDATTQEELLADYLPYTETVRIPNAPPAVPKCRDPYDVLFLYLAEVGKAQVLVTGDHDLLVLAGSVPFEVLTRSEFLQML